MQWLIILLPIRIATIEGEPAIHDKDSSLASWLLLVKIRPLAFGAWPNLVGWLSMIQVSDTNIILSVIQCYAVIELYILRTSTSFQATSSCETLSHQPFLQGFRLFPGGASPIAARHGRRRGGWCLVRHSDLADLGRLFRCKKMGVPWKMVYHILGEIYL